MPLVGLRFNLFIKTLHITEKLVSFARKLTCLLYLSYFIPDHKYFIAAVFSFSQMKSHKGKGYSALRTICNPLSIYPSKQYIMNAVHLNENPCCLINRLLFFLYFAL